MTGVGLGVATGALHLAVLAVLVAPLAWWAARRRREAALTPTALRALAVAAGVYLGSLAVLYLPRVGFFTELTWNWQNKLLLFGLLCLLVAGWRPLTWEQVGVRRPAPRWWLPVLAITLGAFGLQLVIGPVSGPVPLTVETVAFQAVVPGLDEELLFRGVLLVLFDRALAARRRIAGGELGWGGAATALLFGLPHGLTVEPGLAVSVDPAAVVFTGLIGAVLVWVRVRTASLLPAVLVHNGINLSAVLAAAVSG